MHRALLVFHRWLALITGVLLILIALSGAVLVFEGPIANANAVHVVPGGRFARVPPPVSRPTSS